MELVERSLVEMVVAVRSREVSALELFEAHTARIEERDPAVNALVLPRLDEAREEAIAADAAPPLGGAWSAEIDGVPTNPGGKLTLATYASALGLPAVCVPVMRAEGSGLPVGVQLIGARGSERTLVSLASELESLGGWLRPAA